MGITFKQLYLIIFKSGILLNIIMLNRSTEDRAACYKTWSIKQVCDWVCEIGFAQYESNFSELITRKTQSHWPTPQQTN